jgi:hypothetical protein
MHACMLRSMTTPASTITNPTWFSSSDMAAQPCGGTRWGLELCLPQLYHSNLCLVGSKCLSMALHSNSANCVDEALLQLLPNGCRGQQVEGYGHAVSSTKPYCYCLQVR